MKIDRNAVYGIYVHIPFCVKKCAYCDFTSYPGLSSRADCYLEALTAERECYRGLCADTVYIGGGTPTSLQKEQLVGLIHQIRECFRLTEHCEITVECNPKTVDETYFRALREVGVNRLSIGVQSFSERELRLLGRIHSANEAVECVRMAKCAGFANINLDLMFGLPGQTLADFEQSISQVVALAPTHISCYSLILEEGTPLCKEVEDGNLSLPDEEMERAMYHTLIKRLAEKGYEQYEISNFAISGKESRHNNKYWERKPYVGLGAAAHSHVGNVRFGNPASLDEYEKVVSLTPFAGRKCEYLTQSDEMAEFMFLGLRKMCGVSKKQFCKLFARPIETVYGRQIEKFCRLGLLVEDGDVLRLTEKGIDVSNSVFCEFI